MRGTTRYLQWYLALACICGLLCQPLAGCGPTAAPEWLPVSEGIKRHSDVILVAIAPHDPQIVFLATYEPGGLYRSLDGGASWQTANTGLEPVTVLSLAPHPADDQTLLAGTVYGGYKSTDGGQTWVPVPNLPGTYVYAVAWSPDGEAIHVGTEGHGVYSSRDGGLSWRNLGPEGVSVLSWFQRAAIIAV
jgi:hypothetical protein